MINPCSFHLKLDALKPIITFLLLLVTAANVSIAQSFINTTASLGESFNSGGCVGVTDMNNDGFDDIIILHNSRHLRIAYQVPGGWDLVSYGTVSGNNQWGMAIGDISETGHRDVVCGGSYDGVHHVKIDEQGTFEQIALSNGSMFMQACNVVDIDNDGHLDFFACHDDALSRIWRNNGSGGLTPNTDLIDLTDYDTGAYPNTDHSGNYGSVWSDINDDGSVDLVIAKCRQFVSNPFDPRRINQAWMNDGDGNYTEEAFDRGLVLYEQSWTVDFADVNNDGYFDCLITNHSGTMTLLLNDGNGFFEDITVAAGLDIAGFFLQAKMVDFDNDGWVDLVYAGGVHGYFKNNGDNTFTEVPGMFPYSDTMHSFGIGDLNKDGFLDVYASYGNTYVNPDANNPDILWMNEGNSNNWIAFDLEGTESNADAIGAKIKLYGDWGIQVREVRAGESYGIVNSFHLNFGIGNHETVESAVITWPSGNVTLIENPEINTYHQIIEGGCNLAPVTIAVEGATQLCQGETATLVAPEGYSYLWSNGATTAAIEVEQTGFYSVIVQDNDGCAGGSNAIGITLVQPSLPTITVNGDLAFCEGGSVTLTSSDASLYTWSNGEETASIEVTESGEYHVAVIDVCATESVSETVEVVVYPAPDAPSMPLAITTDELEAAITLPEGDYNWYVLENLGDDPTWIASGNQVAYTDDEFLTELGFLPNFICAEQVSLFGGDESTGGKAEATTDGGQFHFNSNFWPRFDAHNDLVIESVKVYPGETGERTFALINSSNTILDQVTVLVTAVTDEFGEPLLVPQEISLGFSVPQGENYGLRCLDSNPQLWRDGPPAEVNYPYALGDLATITTSSVSGANALNFYYFFYDWKVSSPTFECASERVCTEIERESSVAQLEMNVGMSVYPNPAQTIAAIELRGFSSGVVELLIFDATGRAVDQQQMAVSDQHRFDLDVSRFSTGVYTVVARGAHHQAQSRLLID